MVVDGAQTGHHDIADRIRPLMQRANVARIYYCHGFASHFETNKDKVRALSAAAIVDGNTVDYTLPPHKVDERQPSWPVPTTTLAGGAERKTGLPVWRAAPPA